MKKYYMHTLDGFPAFFDKQTNLVCFAGQGKGAVNFNILSSSLGRIRTERKHSIASESKGSDFEYGHLVVYLPDSPS